jgi:hypothetical protein
MGLFCLHSVWTCFQELLLFLWRTNFVWIFCVSVSVSENYLSWDKTPFSNYIQRPECYKNVFEYRVVRWFVFKPKIPTWVNFGGSCNRKCYIFWPFGLFYGHWKYFTAFGIFCGHVVYFSPFWFVVPRQILFVRVYMHALSLNFSCTFQCLTS